MTITRKKLSQIACLILLCAPLSLHATRESSPHSAPRNKQSVYCPITRKTKSCCVGLCCLGAFIYLRVAAPCHSSAPLPMKMEDSPHTNLCEFNERFQRKEPAGLDPDGHQLLRFLDKRCGHHIDQKQCPQFKEPLCIDGEHKADLIYQPTPTTFPSLFPSVTYFLSSVKSFPAPVNNDQCKEE
jgi:hypothetical protein